LISVSEIVNLRQARKRKRRADDERIADANRLQHGRTKAEKLMTSRRNAMTERGLAGHRRDGRDSKT
jgi:hypothetical protein